MNRQELVLRIIPVIVAAALAGLAGCQRAMPAAAAGKPPEVVLVSRPVEGEITDFEDFTGRTEAHKSVEVRARVSGYLVKGGGDPSNTDPTILFHDGSDVEKGQPLFEIDPRPYRAKLAQTQASLSSAEAKVKLAEIEYKRAVNLGNRGSYSHEEVEQATDNYAEARAGVELARAAREEAQLNVDFTTVTAPIAGRISRRMVDIGNMVQADTTPLTTIVAPDPLYIYFEIDERTLLKLRRLIREGKIQSRRETTIRFLAALADEDEYSHEGVIDFSDNKVDPNTGTLQVRGSVANPKPYLLSPGLFVRVRLPIGKPYKALMVAEQALGTDQGRKYVYVVNDKGEVEFRPVKIGALNNGLRVVQEGLKPGERVIVSGLQRIRPGAKVVAKPAPELADASPVQNLRATDKAPRSQVALTTEGTAGAVSGDAAHPAPGQGE